VLEIEGRFQMVIIIGIIKTILACFILTYISVNLLGYVVRGLLWSPPSTDEIDKAVLEEIAKQKLIMTHKENFILTWIPIVFTGVYFFILYHFWNLGLVAAAGIIMLSRLPDLLWEIKHGVKVTKNTGPSSGYLFGLVTLFSYVLIWYSLCKWPL
jgi:hypothetical protein